MTAPGGSWSWSLPQHRSRCGASHHRRGLHCQDASLSASLQSADGQAIGLMAVADGHGSSRYWLSDVGSRLACELAIALAAQELVAQPLLDGTLQQLEAVRHWLAEEWPQRLVSAWQSAIQADWQGRTLPPEHCSDAFSSQTYGSTLGLVVLTPQWWAHTGLGDWDLVLLGDAQQSDRIISQENLPGLQAEATESLCQRNASRSFAARTGVYPLTGDQRQACGVVLSTDGIRKSCASDADHLALCRYLLEEGQPQQLNTAGESTRLDPSLDRISREGSGDDVSVAIAWFGELDREPSAARTPPLPDLSLDQAGPPPPEPRPSAALQSIRQLDWRRWLLVAWLLAAATGLGSAGVFWWRQQSATRPRSRESLSWRAEQRAGMHQAIARLCKQPALIEPSLKARVLQFRLGSNPPAEPLSRNDWLGVLIASSRPGQPAGQSEPVCPELAAALQRYWLDQPNKKPSTQGIPNRNGRSMEF